MNALQKRYTTLEKNSKTKIASLKKESDSLVSSAFVLDTELVAQKAAYLELQKVNERLQDEMSSKVKESLNKRRSFVSELEEKMEKMAILGQKLMRRGRRRRRRRNLFSQIPRNHKKGGNTHVRNL